MNVGQIELSKFLTDFQFEGAFPEEADTTLSREVNRDGTIVRSVVEIFDDGSKYILQFSRDDYEDGARTGTSVNFTGEFIPGQETIQIFHEEPTEADELYDSLWGN